MATSTQEWIDELKSHLRARALRAHQGARGGVRRLGDGRRRRGPGRRRRWRRGRCRGGGADRVRRRPHRRRRQEDPGHQGRPRGDRPRPQGGQGARRRGPQARSRRASSARRPTSSRPSSRRPARASRSSRRLPPHQPYRRAPLAAPSVVPGLKSPRRDSDAWGTSRTLPSRPRRSIGDLVKKTIVACVAVALLAGRRRRPPRR